MSFGQKALMKKSKPTAIEINRSIIVDQVASFLHATNTIPNSKEITDIKFGDISGNSIKLEIYTRKEVRNKN